MRPRSRAMAPVLAALLAVAVVVLVVVAAGSGGRSGPVPPGPPLPVSLDLGGQSLDRCAIAIDASGLGGRYPDRRAWRILAVLFTGDTVVTLLDGPVPFACVTGPRTVQVSDPAAAVPVGPARLVLTTGPGVVVATSPLPVQVTVAGGGTQTGAAGRYLLRVTGVPLTRPDQLTVTVGSGGGAAPDRIARPALDLTDRPWVSDDRPAATDDLLERCRAARLGTEEPRPWQAAHALAYGRGVVLVAISTATVGGCTVGPEGATPLRDWRIGLISDGPRPFTWLPRPGETLPDLGADIAAGPVQPDVDRMEILDRTGRRWEAGIAGGTFATQLPAGVAPDPRNLTVRAFDARNRLFYDGPAVD